MTKQLVTNDEIMATLSQFASSVDTRLDKADDNFEKMFVASEKRFMAFEKRLGRIEENMATKDDIRQLESVIDSYAAKIDDYTKEMAAMQHKIDRLERMVLYLADKANIPRDVLETV